MTVRELLELAAKAAGMAGYTWSDEARCLVRTVHDEIIGEHWQQWRPHTDDGDALRLAAQLRMAIDHNHPADDPRRWVSVGVSDRFGVQEFYDETKRTEATRRAIVRAAAEMGRKAP